MARKRASIGHLKPKNGLSSVPNKHISTQEAEESAWKVAYSVLIRLSPPTLPLVSAYVIPPRKLADDLKASGSIRDALQAEADRQFVPLYRTLPMSKKEHLSDV